MPNHVHLILVPADPDGLRRTLADVHRRYTAHINLRHGWTGHLWQGRFGSVAMDEDHLACAARYVALNPVRARLAERVEDWPWSSARAHLAGRDDGVVRVAPLLERFGDVAAFLDQPRDNEESAFDRLRRGETTGRPAGDDAWIGRLEREHGRALKPGKRGPKPKSGEAMAPAGTGDLFGKLSP